MRWPHLPPGVSLMEATSLDGSRSLVYEIVCPNNQSITLVIQHAHIGSIPSHGHRLLTDEARQAFLDRADWATRDLIMRELQSVEIYNLLAPVD